MRNMNWVNVKLMFRESVTRGITTATRVCRIFVIGYKDGRCASCRRNRFPDAITPGAGFGPCPDKWRHSSSGVTNCPRSEILTVWHVYASGEPLNCVMIYVDTSVMRGRMSIIQSFVNDRAGKHALPFNCSSRKKLITHSSIAEWRPEFSPAYSCPSSKRNYSIIVSSGRSPKNKKLLRLWNIYIIWEKICSSFWLSDHLMMKTFGTILNAGIAFDTKICRW